MEYKDIKPFIKTPSQYICAKIGYNSRNPLAESMLNDTKYWLESIINKELQPDADGKYSGIWMQVEGKGTKEECQNIQAKRRFCRQAYGSTSRLVQLGMWKDSWRILPADEHGHWIPSASMIKKALTLI